MLFANVRFPPIPVISYQAAPSGSQGLAPGLVWLAAVAEALLDRAELDRLSLKAATANLLSPLVKSAVQKPVFSPLPGPRRFRGWDDRLGRPVL